MHRQALLLLVSLFFLAYLPRVAQGNKFSLRLNATMDHW